MKFKKTGIFLIFCIVIPGVGAFTGLQYKKVILKRSVKRRMIAQRDEDGEDLVLLKFTKAESQSVLNWEHKREFEYKGRMYDVIETEVEGDTVSYLCWPDHEESKLNRQLRTIIAFLLGKDRQSKETQKRLVHFLKSLYFSNANVWPFTVDRAEQLFTICRFQYSSVFISPPVPPPKNS